MVEPCGAGKAVELALKAEDELRCKSLADIVRLGVMQTDSGPGTPESGDREADLIFVCVGGKHVAAALSPYYFFKDPECREHAAATVLSGLHTCSPTLRLHMTIECMTVLGVRGSTYRGMWVSSFTYV